LHHLQVQSPLRSNNEEYTIYGRERAVVSVFEEDVDLLLVRHFFFLDTFVDKKSETFLGS